jgi:hypothetical protein
MDAQVGGVPALLHLGYQITWVGELSFTTPNEHQHGLLLRAARY